MAKMPGGCPCLDLQQCLCFEDWRNCQSRTELFMRRYCGSEDCDGVPDSVLEAESAIEEEREREHLILVPVSWLEWLVKGASKLVFG